MGNDPVVNAHEESAASGFPATSVMPVVTVAVYVVLLASIVVGVNVAVFPVARTVPVTPATLNVPVSTVEAFIVSEKVVRTTVAGLTAVLPFGGKSDVIVGAVVSGGGVVTPSSPSHEPISNKTGIERTTEISTALR
jgi:hypothetical protein